MITGQGVTLADAFGEGLKVTGLGLAIVFAVLVILMIVLYLFKVIFYRPAKETAVSEAEPVQVPEPAAAAAAEDADDEELIAVLAAAAAACMNTSTYNLRIKSYRRVDNHVPAWNRAGVNQTIENRTF